MKLLRSAFVAGLAAVGFAGAAHAGTDVHLSIGLGAPGPVYVAPPPVYYAPPPPPVYYVRPAPVYYESYVYAPVYPRHKHKHKNKHRARFGAPVYVY